MEFWGVEVKPGKSTKVEPESGTLIHISQASLGEGNNDVGGSINVPLRVKINDKDFVIGTLAPEDRPQLMFDLVFEKAFELSHDWKDGSVYFLGYIAEDPDADVAELSTDDELVENKANGGLNLDAVPKKEEPSDSDDEGEEDSDDVVDGDDKSEQDSEDDDDSEEEEEMPKTSNKRPASPSLEAEAPGKQVSRVRA